MTGTRFEPRELWRDDGHLSDLALSALADGQESLVAEGAVSHVGSCSGCSERLGAAALQSLRVTVTLEREAEVRAPTPARLRSARLPALGLAAAFVLAMLGSVPRLLELGSALGQASGGGAEVALAVLKGAALLFRTASREDLPAVTLAWCAAAIALLTVGARIVRLAAPEDVERNRHASLDR